MSHTDSESKTKDDVYYERNLNALAFIRAVRDVHNEVYSNEDVEMGWWPDKDTVNESEWAVAWVNIGPGQVGWHIPMDMVPDWLPKNDPNYDGYTTEQKNQRVEDFIYD